MSEKSPCPDYIDEEEWNDFVQWVKGTPRQQQDSIINLVLKNERKGRRPHIKKLIQQAFSLAALKANN